MRLSFILTLIILTGCKSLLEKYPDDNYIEELVEQIIHSETGIDLDLSPYSKES